MWICVGLDAAVLEVALGAESREGGGGMRGERAGGEWAGVGSTSNPHASLPLRRGKRPLRAVLLQRADRTLHR